MEALLVAAIGVCGTLCATWLTQRNSARTLEAERRSTESLRRREEEARGEERIQELRRASYIALNQAARRYFGTLTNELHGLSEGMGDLEELDKARDGYRACYAEAQMVVPDTILTVASAANRELNQAYGILKRLGGGSLRQNDSPRQARTHLDAARGMLVELRQEMRLDLGVTQPVRAGGCTGSRVIPSDE
ncbi:hypothetical protein ABZX38_24430 [Streptomyces longwoodensis]|uniref:hypothetical protein n=1 Tax=Streptomyces longwoodensis TaxID=68231 RepID=UPI0033A0A10B